MKQRIYVAPCAAPQKNEAVTMTMIALGLLLMVGGAEAVADANMLPGIAGVVIGLVLAFKGAVRIPRA
jgi:hypothetical protein